MSKKSIKCAGMAQKSTTSGKSKNTKKSSKSSARKYSSGKTTRSRTSRKSKSKLPAYKVFVYCALAVSFCILTYLIADIAVKLPEQPEAPALIERYKDSDKISSEKSHKNDEKKSDSSSVKKTETAKSVAETVKKIEPPSKNNATAKSSGKTANSTKPVVSEKIENTTQNVAGTKIDTGNNTGGGTKGSAENLNSNAAKTSNRTENSASAKNNTLNNSVLKSSFNFPAAQNGAKLIFLFDDGGQNMAQLEKFVTLPFPVTVAVLPQIAHSSEAAERVRNSGNELMLHQPMQSVNASVNPGPGAITPDMTEDQIVSTLFTNVNQLAPIAGFNNHEGSAITADAEKMAVVMKFASEEGIYFLDSRTNVETKVPYVAEQLGYSYYERNIFLDNEKTRENVLKELNKGLILANKNGQAIMIGHVWSADFLPQILREVYPELSQKGYKFCVVSQSAKKYN